MPGVTLNGARLISLLHGRFPIKCDRAKKDNYKQQSRSFYLICNFALMHEIDISRSALTSYELMRSDRDVTQ